MFEAVVGIDLLHFVMALRTGAIHTLAAKEFLNAFLAFGVALFGGALVVGWAIDAWRGNN